MGQSYTTLASPNRNDKEVNEERKKYMDEQIDRPIRKEKFETNLRQQNSDVDKYNCNRKYFEMLESYAFTDCTYNDWKHDKLCKLSMENITEFIDKCKSNPVNNQI